ncbi:hypothetical protein [Streptomyces sp. NPDC126503]|uniref:hypothetical protein n=1 Tax=Streptomyces sp. NPDC126503 TaxID=3155315 RepID=UPI00332D5AAB
MLNTPIPRDLCPTHRQMAFNWRENHYDCRNPGEWPTGKSVSYRTRIIDSRTSHEQRERWFDEKNQEQIDLVVQVCRSGRSPQCTPAVEVPGPRPVVDVHLPAA